MKVKSLSRVRLFTTPWTAAYQAPPSMGFSRQEYWSRVPLPSLIRFLEESDSQRQEIDGGARNWGTRWGVSVSWGQSFSWGVEKVLEMTMGMVA